MFWIHYVQLGEVFLFLKSDILVKKSNSEIYQTPFPSHNVEEAQDAKNEMNGTKLDGYTVRVDYSVTKEQHPRRDRHDRNSVRELDAYIPNKRLAHRLNSSFDRRRVDGDRRYNRSSRNLGGGNNPAVDAKTGRREEWMGSSRYKGGYLR